MPRVHLTDIAVRNLRAPERGQLDYWDRSTRRFGVRVSYAGTKTFIVKVRNARQAIGTYPILSLRDARKKALTLKAQEATPVANLSFDGVYEVFKRDHISAKRKTTAYGYARVIEKYLLPYFAKTPLSKITYERITAITDRLCDTPGEQAHTLATMRTFFRWCTRPPRRYIAHSPLEGLQIKLGKPRTRTLSDAELVRVWRAADAQAYPHGYVIKLLILWGLRKGEVGQLIWQWINERECTVALPPAVTKNRTEHVFPYGPLAEQILASIPRRNSTPFLFPTRYEDDRPFSGWSKFKTELNDGCVHWTLHDLRRTFATGLARLAVPPHVVERLLNHKLGSVTNQTNSIVTAVAEIYNRHRYLPEMREALITWEQHVLSLLARAARSDEPAAA